MSININNPGNIRPLSKGLWDGQASVSDKGFVIFKSMAYGIRASLKDLHSKITVDGLNTIRKIVTKYAPPTGTDGGNDTQVYINTMCIKTGLKADAPIPISRAFLQGYLNAQYSIEDGSSSHLITQDDFDQAFALFNESVPGWVNS